MKLFFDLFPIILFFGAFKFGESDPQTAADILTVITGGTGPEHARSEEHTSELQSH